jgi:hypothetical protein
VLYSVTNKNTELSYWVTFFVLFLVLVLVLVFETGSSYVSQAGLKFKILLPLSPKGWDYRCAPAESLLNMLT